MGVLLAFALGWGVGARAGSAGFDEVVEALQTVRRSEELEALLAVARAHLAAALSEVGKLVSGETPVPEPVDLLARVQRLAGPAR
jgi:hypothetical protein